MFLDEELDQIHSENYGKENCAILLLKAMISRMPKEDEVATINPNDFLNTIKRIDNSWKLFCKKHSGAYKEDDNIVSEELENNDEQILENEEIINE